MQQTIAATMILGGSVLTAWASGDIAFPAILCILGLLGMRRRFTWDIRPERRFITPLLLLLLAVLFALHCRYANVRSDQAAAFAWQTIARYFLASMILILFLRPPNRLPPSLGLFHLATVMAGGQALLLDDRYVSFRLAELLSVTLVVLYAAADHEPRDTDRVTPGVQVGTPGGTRLRKRHRGTWFHATRLAILFLAINLGWVGGSLLYRNVETLNFLPAWLWREGIGLEAASAGISRIAFSTSGRLSSLLAIKEEQDPTPMLSITADVNPGYLRARAFEIYRESEWRDISYRAAITPEQSTPFGVYLVARMKLFRIQETKALRHMVIRHQSIIGDAMFTPLGTCSVEAPFDLLMRDDDDVVEPPNPRGNLSYRVGYTPTVRGNPPSDVQRRRMLNIPTDLDARIHQLASRIFADSDTTGEKIDAVVDYFRTNYAYSLGVDVPPGRDRLTHFLLEESAGYCEYFASGTAILLRLAGVPTRYVTGFFVSEQDEQGESWIARYMDAHAWVEAWDQERYEWTIVEATVQESLGETSLADGLLGQDGSGRLFLAQFLKALYEYGVFGVVAWLSKSYSLVTGLSLSLSFLGGAAWLALFRRYARSRRGYRRQRARGPEFAALHKLLQAMDRKVKATGLRRALGETLHAFSGRVRSRAPADGPWHRVADWYLDYADLRYGGEIGPERVLQLQQRGQDLRRAL